MSPGIVVANIIIVVVMFVTFYIAVNEYRANRRRDIEDRQSALERDKREREISREESAKTLYRDYLKVAIEYPELSAAKYNKDDAIDTDRYDTFLSIMLYSFDEGVNYTDSEFFLSTIKWQIRVHDEYIRQILHRDVPDSDSFRSVYSEKFLRYVDEAFDEIDEEKGDSGPSQAPTQHKGP